MNDSVFAKNLKAFINSNDYRQEDIAASIGVTLTSLNGWLNRGIQPRQENISRLMSKYNLSQDDLMSSRDGYYARIHNLQDKPEGAIAVAQSPKATLPLLGTVHAGDAQEPNIVELEVEVPAHVQKNHPNGYLLEVVGDCMSKVYPEGSLILIDKDMQPQNGSIGVFMIDGSDFIMRRVYRGANTLILSPESYNDEWEDIVISDPDNHEVVSEGVVVWYQAPKELE